MATVKSYAQFFLLMFAALTLSACALAPQTPKQTMAATYVSIESVADAAFLAYQTGEIDRETTTLIYRKLQEAKSYVDLTAITAGSDFTKSDQGRLVQARAILLELEELLREKSNE